MSSVMVYLAFFQSNFLLGRSVRMFLRRSQTSLREEGKGPVRKMRKRRERVMYHADRELTLIQLLFMQVSIN